MGALAESVGGDETVGKSGGERQAGEDGGRKKNGFTCVRTE